MLAADREAGRSWAASALTFEVSDAFREGLCILSGPSILVNNSFPQDFGCVQRATKRVRQTAPICNKSEKRWGYKHFPPDWQAFCHGELTQTPAPQGERTLKLILASSLLEYDEPNQMPRACSLAARVLRHSDQSPPLTSDSTLDSFCSTACLKMAGVELPRRADMPAQAEGKHE